MRNEVGKVSTFHMSRKNMMGWKKPIDEHIGLNRELTAEKARYDVKFDKIILMKPPFRSAIVGRGRECRRSSAPNVP